MNMMFFPSRNMNSWYWPFFWNGHSFLSLCEITKKKKSVFDRLNDMEKFSWWWIVIVSWIFFFSLVEHSNSNCRTYIYAVLTAIINVSFIFYFSVYCHRFVLKIHEKLFSAIQRVNVCIDVLEVDPSIFHDPFEVYGNILRVIQDYSWVFF